jgi:ureidoacrylate peracid hydrolase
MSENTTRLVLPGRYYTHTNDTNQYEEQRFPPGETALLIVDVYGLGYDEGVDDQDYYIMGSELQFKREKNIVRNYIRPAIDLAREAGLHVVYVTNWDPRNAANSGEFGKYCKRFHGQDIEEVFVAGGSQLSFSEVVKPRSDDHLVRKQMYDGFFETELDSLLRNLGVKNLIAVGFALNICLGTTLLSAFYRNYRVVMVRDATLAFEYPDTVADMLETKSWIRYIESFVGFTVSLEEYREACRKLIEEPVAA